MPAWAARSDWSPSDVRDYSSFVAHAPLHGPFAGLTTFTCEDLALALLIDFAYRHKLPVRISNGSGTYESNSGQFVSMPQYRDRVLRSTGASDLAWSENTVPATPGVAPGSLDGLRRALPGDIVLIGVGYWHSQVVKEVRQSSIVIFQGNFGEGCRFSGFMGQVGIVLQGESSPTTPCYLGIAPERGEYDLAADSYVRESMSMTATDAYSDGSEVRRWNYAKFTA